MDNEAAEVDPPVARIEWKPCCRIIPSRFPPVQLFERVTDPGDRGAIFELESRTNSRVRDASGEIRLVPEGERVSGPGTSVIMAAFTHRNPDGSRFSDGTFGVFYASRSLATAIAETKHHRERFMLATAEPRMELDMRVYLVDLVGNLHDLRNQRAAYPLVYRPNSHSVSQNVARELLGNGSNGIAYDSVRHDGGECAAVSRPRLLSNCRQERHLCYVWDGRQIENIYEKRSLDVRKFT